MNDSNFINVDSSDIVSVMIIEENKGGYIVEFDDGSNGFMPYSQSGYGPKEIGIRLDVIVTGHTDKPIVSRNKAMYKQNDLAKRRLIMRADSLTDMPNPEEAISQWHRLLDEWKSIGRTTNDNELWERFIYVQRKLLVKKAQWQQEAKARMEQRKREILSQIAPRSVFDSKVTNIHQNRVFVQIETRGVTLTGYVPFSELSYSYISDISTFIKVGDARRVVVLEVDASRQTLKLGMKQLEQAHASSTESKIEDASGTGITATISRVKYPGLIITEPLDDCAIGIVLPEDLTLDGSPICASAISELTKQLNVGDKITVDVKSRSADGKVAFLNYDIKMEHKPDIIAGNVTDVTVREICGLYVKVDTPDNSLAYIETAEFGADVPTVGTTLAARIVRVADNVLQFSRYTTLNLDKDFDAARVLMDSDSRFREIFTDEELEELCQSGAALETVEELRTIFDAYHRLLIADNRKEMKCNISIKTTTDTERYRGQFEHECPTLFSGKSMKVCHDPKQKQMYLWDGDETLIIASCGNDNTLRLHRLYFGGRNPDAHNIIRRYKNTKLLISGDRIRLVPFTSESPATDFDEVTNLIDAIQRINKLKYDLSKKVSKEIAGQAELYQSASDFLDWQIERETGRIGDTIFIDADHIVGRVTGRRGTLTLGVRIPASDANRLINDEDVYENAADDDIRVAVMKTPDTQNPVTAILKNERGDIWHLEFSRSMESVSWTSDGIYIQLKPSVRHLKIQETAIEEYVKNDNLDMLTDIVYNQLGEIDDSAYGDIEFFNPIFNSVEDDNRQVEAVKKALAAEKIMLIQGPPGTGKTTVIVEIIRQLVKQGKRVLVCCQANPAVDNILTKLESIGRDNPVEALQLIRVRNEGELDTSAKERNVDLFRSFLQQQLKLLKMLEVGRDLADIDSLVDTSGYKSEEPLCRAHRQLVEAFPNLKELDSSALISAFEQLSDDHEFHRFYNNRECDFKYADVVLGTCIGVGMTRGLSEGMFDVVIIDEAAKANVGESIVPMRLGKKHILVGDDQQLPPYVNTLEIRNFVDSSSAGADTDRSRFKQIINFQKTSLFEDVHHKIPESCVVTLNYQHRMNPRIGDCISHLFYADGIKNGPLTDRRVIESELFPNQVTFIDTATFRPQGSDRDSRIYEERTLGDSLLNRKESDIICHHIIPAVEAMIGSANPAEFLGIISPYAAQVNLLRSMLPDQFRECVHTIDSIQGSEYEVVIFSFVRSFSKVYAKRPDVNVGFVADMRRLNVSLSRAKCKLIMVGNLKTLTNPDAFNHISSEVVGQKHPLDVFRKMSEYTTSVTRRTAKDIFINHLRSVLKPGYVLTDCLITEDSIRPNLRKFKYQYNGECIELIAYAPGTVTGQTVNIVYAGDNDNNRPQFKVQTPPKWSAEQIDTINNWIQSKSDISAEVVEVGARLVTLSAQGIEGTISRSYFHQGVNIGGRFNVQVYEFKPNKGLLTFKVTRKWTRR